MPSQPCPLTVLARQKMAFSLAQAPYPPLVHTATDCSLCSMAPSNISIFSFPLGDFQFSVASDDNSEFWLSSDESPSNTRLVAFVGRVGHPLQLLPLASLGAINLCSQCC